MLLRLTPGRSLPHGIFGLYVRDPVIGLAHAHGMLVLTLADSRIRAMTGFDNSVELKASLGSTVVEIRVADPADIQRAAERLQRIAPADVLGGGTLAVKVPDKGPAVQQVIRLLDAGAIVPESLAIREPTLDDVFLQLTGHRAGPSPVEPAPQAAGAGGAN